jgi:uncharacterized membrane protein SirB2
MFKISQDFSCRRNDNFRVKKFLKISPVVEMTILGRNDNFRVKKFLKISPVVEMTILG